MASVTITQHSPSANRNRLRMKNFKDTSCFVLSTWTLKLFTLFLSWNLGSMNYTQAQVYPNCPAAPTPNFPVYDWQSDARTEVSLDIRQFGANPDDNLDDTWAFIKASWYIANIADINGVKFTTQSNPNFNIDYNTHKVKLSIPGGSTLNSKYIVGLQQKFMDPANPALYSVFQAVGNGFHIPSVPQQNTIPPGSGLSPISFNSPWVFRLPYSYIFNSSNSSHNTWNGTQVNSFPDPSFSDGAIVQFIDELTADAFGNNYPLLSWDSHEYCSNGNIKVCNGITHSGNESRRVLSVDNVPDNPSYGINCNSPQPCTLNAERYNRTLPYTVATDIFLIDNIRDQPVSGNFVSGLFIRGVASSDQPQPKIVYSDGVLGATDAVGNKQDLGDYLFNGVDPSMVDPDAWDIKGHFGQAASNAQPTAFLLRKVNQVQFENLEINGNIQNHVRKGASSGDGLEYGAQGLSLATKNTTIKHMYIHHMPIDGIAVVAPECAEDANFYGQDIISEYNGRCGLDMGSGRKVQFDNCKFNHQGCALSTVQVNQNNQPLQCAVAFSCGVDLEHEDYCLGISQPPAGKLPIEDVVFNCCEFNFNAQMAVINDCDGGPDDVKVRGVTFNTCEFHRVDDATSLTGYGMKIGGENYNFNNCNIWCHIHGLYWFNAPNGEAKFKNCHFEDKPLNGVSWNSNLKELINTFESLLPMYKPLFQNCDFKVHSDQRDFIQLQSTPSDPDKWAVFDNCTFEYLDAGGGVPNYTNSLLRGAKFKNINTITNKATGLNYPCSAGTRRIKLGCILVEGGNNACSAGSLIFNGNIDVQMDGYPTGEIRVGELAGVSSPLFARMMFKNGSLLHYPYPPVSLTVGSNSYISIQSQSGMITANANINGGLFLEKKSYLHQHSDNPQVGVATINANLGSKFFIHETVNNTNNSVTIPPFWNSSACDFTSGFQINQSFWSGNISLGSGVCINGNHSGLPASPCTNGGYLNSKTDGAFAILYNVTNSTTCSSNDGQFSCEAFGGVAPISYAINPSANFNSLQSGHYTVTATDANGCTATVDFDVLGGLSFTGSTITNVKCNNTLGSVITAISGGAGTLTYSITPNANTGSTPGSFTGMSAGIYTITATDASGCTATTSVIITAPTQGGHCACQQGINIVTNTPNLILIGSTSASNLINQYNNGVNVFTN